MYLLQSLAASLQKDRCDIVRSPNYGSTTLSLLLIVGLFVSYLPQHYSIYRRRSPAGISPWYILLGATGSTSSFATILTLSSSRTHMACCSSVSQFECVAGLLVIIQIGVQWICWVGIVVLFLYFFHQDPIALYPEGEESEGEDTKPAAMYDQKTAYSVGTLCLLHLVAVGCASLALARNHPHRLHGWANSMGIVAAILAIIQYLPQIYLTWSIKMMGSLSVPMMLIQVPGSFVFAASILLSVGIEGWASWGVYILTAFLQGTLLFMAFWFRYTQDKHDTREGENEGARSTCTPMLTVTDSSQTGACIVGYIPGPRRNESDDEGTVAVENERAPLLKASSRKVSRNGYKNR
ncbi:hypothetical protein BJ878DRAFT_449547 [Calycina marina]|uniref:PQ loop repeat protein n=1 Tax=Calycina marina TaxID=1763456 RepID=A0A9P8CAX8_9HELO|nr:hypothetical protein BJ878DRAFT_449547 [Calycina marina]